MERGLAWSSGTAAAALTGVVLTGGATLGAAVAEAAPVAPRPPVCTIGTAPYLYAPAKPVSAAPIRRGVDADVKGRCVDAISQDLLVPADVAGHALVRVPAAKPKPKPAPVTTTTPPKPAPVTTTPAPTTTTTPPAAGAVVAPPAAPGAEVATPAPAPATPGVVGDVATGPATPPGNATAPRTTTTAPPASTTAPGSSAVRRTTAPAAVRGGAPAPLAAPGAPVAPAAAPGPAAVAPLGAVVPGDAAGVPAVEPASYLDPLGAPGIGALPGEPTILQTLGGDTAGVTTSSRVEALGLDALHRGGGVPAVVGVTIMAGLGGLALRHRILQRIRKAEPAAGGADPAPDQVLDHASERALAAGRRAR